MKCQEKKRAVFFLHSSLFLSYMYIQKQKRPFINCLLMTNYKISVYRNIKKIEAQIFKNISMLQVHIKI